MNQPQPEEAGSNQRAPKLCAHHSLRPNWYCVDPNCKEKVRFACGDCFLDFPHYQHQHKRLIEYESLVRQRCSERISKLRELQPISDIRNKTTTLISTLRNDFKEQIDKLEASIEKQVRLIENHFSSRTLTEINQKWRSLSNKLLFLKFLFCEEEISELSLQLYDNAQYLETNINKEKRKRELISNQFYEHLNKIKESYDYFSSQILDLSNNFAASSANIFNLDSFTQKVVKIDESKPAHSLPIQKVLTLTNNRLMTFSEDATMQIYNQQFALMGSIKHDQKIKQADILSESLVVIASSDKKISVYNVDTTVLVKSFSGHTEPIIALTAISEDSFVSAGLDGNLFVWNLNQDEPVLRQPTSDSEQGNVNCIEKIGLNSFVTSRGDEGKIKIWADQQVVQALNGHTSKVESFRYLSGLNILVSVDDRGVIMLWNLTDFTLVHQFRNEFSDFILDITQISEEAFTVLGQEQNIKVFKFEFDDSELKESETDQNGSNELLEKATVVQGKTIKNISCIMNFSTNVQVNHITKFDEDVLIGGCQDGHLVLIK